MSDSLSINRNTPMTIRRFLSPTVRLKHCWPIGVLFLFLTAGCKQETKSKSGLEIISVDLSQSRNGKLSEFFEPEIEYIWLEDDSEEAQLTSGLQEILFYQDRIYTLDIFGCSCIQIFDKAGTYLSTVKAYGEGPGQYIEFDGAAFVDGELVLLGVYPRKIMWFNLEGEYLREVSLREQLGPGVFSEFDDRYYLYTPTREPGEFFVKSFDKSLKDTINYIPYDPEKLYGAFSGRSFFQKSQENIYFGMTFGDTIFQVEKKGFVPKLIFNFGKYAQDLVELKRIDHPVEKLNFINNSAKLYFTGQYLISEKQLFTMLVYEKKRFNVFFDREHQQTHLIKDRIIDDIDGGFDPDMITYSFEPGKVGIKVPGRDLYKTLLEKKEHMSKAEFENFVNNKGRNFAKTALAARHSENPVLIVYTLAK